MSALANYRFLPWSRRGLVAQIEEVDPLNNAVLPKGRGAIHVAVAINNGPPVVGPAIATYGPGDVIGIDTRVIIRTEPRPQTQDFEPNYLAAIDFDAPDFPWMLTPAAPNVSNGAERLRPWLVLLVFDRERVDPPTVKPGQPLPSIQIDVLAAATELPNLDESWAWAHSQVSVSDEFTGNLAEEIASMPDLNVSRLVCPRRLIPQRRYLACLVPAFDHGVIRGKGQEVDASTALAPAWDLANPKGVELPVYFHWEFSTGLEGDFEALARQLKPILPPPLLGYQKIYLNPAELGLGGLGPAQDATYTWIEGALGVPAAAGSTPGPGEPGAPLEAIPQPIRDRLANRLNEPAAIAAGLSAGATQPLGPPIYGSWSMNEHTVGQTTSLWLRELNLDPRARVAAGLGAEVVRKNQEDFMQACWEQVDEVLKANDLLNRARLAQEVGHRIFTRFFEHRPAEQLIGMMAPMHGGIRYGQATIDLELRRSSLPNRTFDPALRRLLSPQRPWIKRALWRGGLPNTPGVGRPSPSVSFTAWLNRDSPEADPTRFMPDGLVGTRALSRLGGNTAGPLDFNGVGLKAALDAPAAQALTESAQKASAATARGFVPLALSTTLDQSGLLLERHVRDASDLADLGLGQSGGPVVVAELLAELKAVAVLNPTAATLMLSFEAGRLAVHPMFVGLDGGIEIEGTIGGRVLIGRLEPGLRGLSGAEIGRALSTLEPGMLVTQPGTGAIPTLVRAAGHPLKIIRGSPVLVPGQVPVVLGPVLPGRGPGIPGPGPGIPGPGPGIPGPGPGIPNPDPNQVPPLTNTTIPPIKELEALGRYKQAFEQYRDEFNVATPPPATAFAAMAFAEIRGTLLERTDPLTTIPARIRTMVTVNGQSIEGANHLDMLVPATVDRIMVGPKIRQPMYTYLAAYDGQRFLPGIGQVPQDSVVLLATNPRFVEAFMVGLSHEMNRELLWRSYPTDQRGTVFQRFWSWVDGGDDITMIHTWPRNSALGQTARQSAGGSQIVMLIRGQLLRRYPGTVMLAWSGEQRDGRLQLKQNPAPGEVLAPIFSGRFAPDFTFFGFELTPEDIRNGDWFLVLQQQPMEPRFGFDTPRSDRSPPLTSWLDATWKDVGTAEGAYLRLTGNPVAGQTLGDVSLGRDAGHMAAVLLQRPFRAAFDAKKLMARFR